MCIYLHEKNWCGPRLFLYSPSWHMCFGYGIHSVHRTKICAWWMCRFWFGIRIRWLIFRICSEEYDRHTVKTSHAMWLFTLAHPNNIQTNTTYARLIMKIRSGQNTGKQKTRHNPKMNSNLLEDNAQSQIIAYRTQRTRGPWSAANVIKYSTPWWRYRHPTEKC